MSQRMEPKVLIISVDQNIKLPELAEVISLFVPGKSVIYPFFPGKQFQESLNEEKYDVHLFGIGNLQVAIGFSGFYKKWIKESGCDKKNPKLIFLVNEEIPKWVEDDFVECFDYRNRLLHS